MKLRRAFLVAACVLVSAGAAEAQFQPAPQAEQEPPPCIKEFMKLRDATEAKGKAIKAASERKASPQEACKLFNAFTAAEARLIKYASENAVWCGIPPQAVQQMKKGHARATEMRSRICQAAAAPQVPKGPSLSDALGTPAPDSSNIKTGRGTFDTLTGSPLGNK